MIRRIRRLPSPALIVASIALVFAVAGGIGYAASKINGQNIRSQSIGAGKLKQHSITGRQIKSQSIPGGKLQPNTVTGNQVKESTLGKVPQSAQADTATNATNATNAGNANTVDGHQIVTWNTAGSGNMFTLDGLSMSCSGGIVTATTNANARISAVGIDTITDNDTDNRIFNTGLGPGGSTTVVGGPGVVEPDTVSQSEHVYYLNTATNTVVNVDFNVLNSCITNGIAYGG